MKMPPPFVCCLLVVIAPDGQEIDTVMLGDV